MLSSALCDSAAISGIVRYSFCNAFYCYSGQWPLVVNNIVENWFYCRAALQASCVEDCLKGGGKGEGDIGFGLRTKNHEVVLPAEGAI